MTPHKHAEVIKAWADGHPVEYRMPSQEEWKAVDFRYAPAFYEKWEYRVRPQPTLSTQEYHVYQAPGHPFPTFTKAYPSNLRLLFENGKLVGAELIDGR